MDVSITPEQMRQLEKQWLSETCVPSIVLMEEAARGIVHRLLTLCPSAGRVLFLCGPGNNGGDGYAAARFWQQQGGRALMIELQATASGDAAHERLLAVMSGATVINWEEGSSLPEADAVVDALFGTGMNRPLEGRALALVRQVNSLALPVLSVDIPSGLSGRDGRVMGDCIRASVTVTFHRIKQGLLLREAPRYTGSIEVHPILISADYGGCDGFLSMRPAELQSFLPLRNKVSHKGDYGHVLIFAGSMGMAGAACMCARAAVRSGAGLTTLLCRESLVPIFQALVPSAMCVALPERGGILTESASELAAAALRKADAAVIGCGLGLSDDLLPLLHAFRAAKQPIIWDADALTLLSRNEALLPLRSNHIITPHAGEAARLLCTGVEAVLDEPLFSLHQLHRKTGASVLLKGPCSLMYDGNSVAVNRFASPALAKGGSGDVLAGILGALAARRDIRLSMLERMQCAALIHGLAAQRAAEARGEDGMTPDDLIDAICLRG